MAADYIPTGTSTSAVINTNIVDPLKSLETQVGTGFLTIQQRQDELDGELNLFAGDLATAQTAITTAQTQLSATSNTDGTIKAGRVGPTALQAASVATTTIQTGAVTPALLSTDAVAPVNLVPDAFNTKSIAGTNFQGRNRWYRSGTPAVSYLQTIVDGANPFGAPTIRLPGTSTDSSGGKKIWLDETGLKAGDTMTFAALVNASAGTYRLRLDFRTSADGQSGLTNGTISSALSGTATILTVSATIPANTAAINLLVTRATGTSDLDIYALWASKGAYVSSLPTVSPTDPTMTPLPNIVPDPFNNRLTPGTDWGGAPRWYQAGNLTRLSPDANNPIGGGTLRFAYPASPNWGGKLIPLREAGLKVGDKVTFNALVGATAGAYRLRVWFADATGNPSLGTIYNSISTAVSAYGVVLTAPTATVPTGARYVAVFVSRDSGTVPLDIYALWGAAGTDAGMIPAPDTAATDLSAAVSVSSTGLVENAANLDKLTSWKAAIAAVQRGTRSAKVMLIGDSWWQKVDIYAPLRNTLQSLYGDGGVGFIGYGNDKGAGDIPATGGTWTYATAGTWTNSTKQPTSKGPDINHTNSSDTATPASKTVAATGNSYRIHYLQQVGGGSFQWRVDGGAWSANVDTSGAGDTPIALAPAGLTGLSNASHTVDVKVTVGGSAGVTLFGLEVIKTAVGVEVLNFGNSSSAAVHWSQVDATLFQAHMTLHAPDLIMILLGTNDRELDVVPSTTANNLTTLIDRCRVVLPYTDIMIVAPAEGGTTGHPYAMQDYIDAEYGLANVKGCAFYSLASLFGTYARSSTLGIMSGIHNTAQGGQVSANGLVKALKVS
jgi:lysophospholipase L1-like esterase